MSQLPSFDDGYTLSVARAKLAQAEERYAVLKQLGPGWMFSADGRLVRQTVLPWGLSATFDAASEWALGAVIGEALTR